MGERLGDTALWLRVREAAHGPLLRRGWTHDEADDAAQDTLVALQEELEIDGGMARGIADPDVLARTLTAYGAPSRHRRACGLAGPGAGGGREVEALVVTRDGRVLWHATGAPDAATPGEVDAMLRALVPRDGRSADTDAAPSP
jgi:hypothetical protein